MNDKAPIQYPEFQITDEEFDAALSTIRGDITHMVSGIDQLASLIVTLNKFFAGNQELFDRVRNFRDPEFVQRALVTIGCPADHLDPIYEARADLFDHVFNDPELLKLCTVLIEANELAAERGNEAMRLAADRVQAIEKRRQDEFFKTLFGGDDMPEGLKDALVEMGASVSLEDGPHPVDADGNPSYNVAVDNS